MRDSASILTFDLTVAPPESTLSQLSIAMAHSMKRRAPLRVVPVLLFATGLCCCPSATWCQDSGDQGTVSRGDRAEISITVRTNSGEVITAPASVKLYQNGMPTDQSSTSHGRAFFIPRTLGDFTIVAEAAGYKSAQKDVSLPLPVQVEVDIYLQRDLAPNETAGVPGAARRQKNRR